ncbi:serine hydrolase [candidate division KSB1 bacterium]|nr:serine hydrolase [candidate division KSB1 bacterium]
MKFYIPFLLMAVILSFSVCTDKSSDVKELEQAIVSLLRSPDWEVAVAFEDLVTGEKLFINEKEVMHAASTMKTPVMVEVFKQANAGIFSLEDSVTIQNKFKSIVDQSEYSLGEDTEINDRVFKSIGGKMTIRDLVFEMITVSNNLATNILIERVGAQNVMSSLKDIGAVDMQVLRGVEDLKAYEAGLNNVATAYDLYLIMRSIALHKVVDPGSCEEMINILVEQKYRGKIPALLPDDVIVANKTGNITNIDHDSAIILREGKPRYVLIVMTRGIKDHDEASGLIARVSKIIYDSTN